MYKENKYLKIWDKTFQKRNWGKYPPEHLIRFIFKNFKYSNQQEIKILDLGCGPGANLWFLKREGFNVSGIDSSSTAIELSRKRLSKIKTFQDVDYDLKIGDFQSLPWKNNYFDLVIDISALYANTKEVIDKTVNEVYRVLKPQGHLYTKLWGTKSEGFGLGEKISSHTFNKINKGIFVDMGLTTFFDLENIIKVFHMFDCQNIDQILRYNGIRKKILTEEFHCHFQKEK